MRRCKTQWVLKMRRSARRKARASPLLHQSQVDRYVGACLQAIPTLKRARGAGDSDASRFRFADLGCSRRLLAMPRLLRTAEMRDRDTVAIARGLLGRIL